MHKEPIKATLFLKSSLILSSIFIVLISFLFAIFGVCYWKLVSFTLLISVVTIVNLSKKPMNLIPSYMVNNLHLGFWVIITGVMIYYGFTILLLQVVMLICFLIVSLNRKKNFMVDSGT